MLLSANGEFAKNITSINNSFYLTGSPNIDYVYAMHSSILGSYLSVIDGTINSQVDNISLSGQTYAAYYVSSSSYKYIYLINETEITVLNASGGAFIGRVYSSFTPTGAAVSA